MDMEMLIAIGVHNKYYDCSWDCGNSLHTAEDIGLVVRPHKCECCEWRGNVQPHHWDYNRAIDVIWLCNDCHTKLHRYLRGEKVYCPVCP